MEGAHPGFKWAYLPNMTIIQGGKINPKFHLAMSRLE
jgi:hypothetical protein